MDKDLDVMDVDARADGTKAPSTQLDLEDLVLEQGGHFMANKHCELPKDTVKLTRKVREHQKDVGLLQHRWWVVIVLVT